MRPDLHRQIANFSAAQSPSSEATIAVKSEEPGRESEPVHDGGKGSPNDLSCSDVLSALFAEMAQLRQRCDDLEIANSELKADVRAVEETQSALTLASGPGKVPVNLTGYASSESTDVSEPSMDVGRSKREMDSFKAFINSKINTMTAILENFQSDLNAEGVSRYKLGEELERVKHDATKTKGRVGTVEADMREMSREFSEFAISTTEQLRVLVHPTQFGGVLDEVQQTLANVNAELQDLTLEVTHQAVEIETMQTQLAAESTNTTELRVREPNVVSNASPKAVLLSRSNVEQLRAAFIDIDRKLQMQQKVDDLFTKDNLLAAYHQLIRSYDESSGASENEIVYAGDLCGTRDDLLSLAGRALRRLATFDSYGRALEEAKKANVDW